jgi:ribonuclease G
VNELIVSASEEGLRIGILEDKRIVELHHEKTNKLFSVGDILLGKVTKIVPGLNAAFVEIGHPKDAFLHYLDLGPQVMSLQRYVKSVQSSANNIRPLGEISPLPDISKDGRMAQVFKGGQPILVQVEKEAISTKGPRLTCEISLPGQYLILVPFSDDISVSRKIGTNEEKRRLKTVCEAVKPKGFGLIVRTAAEGRDSAAIEKDLLDLIDKWDKMIRSIADARPPKRVLAEEDRAASILRDMLSIGFDSIVTDDETAFEEISDYLKRTSPEQLKNLKMHQGKITLFESRGVEKQIKASFGKTVTMRNGSYLVIEHTEAMHVIDVNSGSKNLRGDTLEDNALKTNMVAAEEIARQLRLRDMGGIIVIDFIDLKKVENKKRLHQHLKDLADEPIWTDPDHKAACAPSARHQHDRDLPFLRRYRHHPILDLDRGRDQKQCRFLDAPKQGEAHGKRASLRRGLLQERILEPSAPMVLAVQKARQGRGRLCPRLHRGQILRSEGRGDQILKQNLLNLQNHSGVLNATPLGAEFAGFSESLGGVECDAFE